MIREALQYIDPHDRDVWVRCAFAIQAALGDSGFDIWDEWSQSASNYNERDARAVWRSCARPTRITVATLYAIAKEAGWRPDKETPLPVRSPPKHRADAEKAIEAKRERAKQVAHHMVTTATIGKHAYLARKGFPDYPALLFEGDLIIPMRYRGVTVSVQRINAAGEKKFLSGGRAKGSHLILGQGEETFYVEGYATGLSVRAAFQELLRQVQVVICFSAQNVPVVAHELGRKRSYVVADNDESQAGAQSAAKTGLPTWTPPDVGTDANDFHLKYGLRALAQHLNKLRRT